MTVQVSQTFMTIWSNLHKFISIFQNFSIDAKERKGCNGCVEVSPIDYYPQVKGFIISYVKDLKDIDYPEISRYCYNKPDCKIEFNQTNNSTHYKYPNGDSKFEFDATFDMPTKESPYKGAKASFSCKNFEVVLHNLCGNCPNNPIQFLNEKNIECSSTARLKPWQHRRSMFVYRLVL